MENRIYKLGHHLVAFLDVLGQRDRLRGLIKLTNARGQKANNRRKMAEKLARCNSLDLADSLRLACHPAKLG